MVAFTKESGSVYEFGRFRLDPVRGDARYQNLLQRVGNTEALSFLGFAYAAAGRKDNALETLRELAEQAKRGYVPPYHLAVIHAGLGEKDLAFEWLERSFEKHAVDLFTLRVEPMFDGLRDDARYQDLLRGVGLESR